MAVARACTLTTSLLSPRSIQGDSVRISGYFCCYLRLTSVALLGRVLRFLATRHVFEEVAPDVFRNTRLSSGMCLGKSVKEIVEEYACTILEWYASVLTVESVRWAGGTARAELLLLFLLSKLRF